MRDGGTTDGDGKVKDITKLVGNHNGLHVVGELGRGDLLGCLSVINQTVSYSILSIIFIIIIISFIYISFFSSRSIISKSVFISLHLFNSLLPSFSKTQKKNKQTNIHDGNIVPREVALGPHNDSLIVRRREREETRRAEREAANGGRVLGPACHVLGPCPDGQLE